MSNFADLHVHTSHSDGVLSPEEVVRLAIKAGLRVLAISDHDTLSGYREAKQHVSDEELIVLPAVELSTAVDDSELHILGYLIDCESSQLAARIEEFQQERLVRGQKIVERLNELGVDLSMDTVMRVAGNSALGRPHVADALISEEYVRTFDEAFARYLGYHAPAYVPKFHMTPVEAVELIHAAHGVAILAHPGTLGRDDLIPSLAKKGLDGVEAVYPLHDHRTVQRYKKMAADHGMIFTGGSDSHGRKSDRAALGSINVPKECYESLLRVKERYIS
ncbi:MAG: PHP domain-containing protein [Candidatus Zixiibacteriota bacterium]